MRYVIVTLLLAILVISPITRISQNPTLSPNCTPQIADEEPATLLEGIDWDEWLFLEGIDWDEWLMLEGIDWDEWLMSIFGLRDPSST